MANLNKADVYSYKQIQLYKQICENILAIIWEETKSLRPHMNPLNNECLGTYVFHSKHLKSSYNSRHLKACLVM